MAEARGVGRPAPFEDQRMWRLLLARLHPDTGGDHELFLFACTVKEEASGGIRAERKPSHGNGEQKVERATEPFLQTWQDAMSCWATRNREALKIL